MYSSNALQQCLRDAKAVAHHQMISDTASVNQWQFAMVLPVVTHHSTGIGTTL